MKTDKEVWEKIAAGYVGEVERALARVEHPRKSEVLLDLKRHLEEVYANLSTDRRSLEDFSAAIEEMGPPEEYAELLSDETAAAAPSRRLRIALLLSLAVLAAVAGYALLWANPAGKTKVLEVLGRDWSAPPFFSKRGFEGITPGMTAAEVRNVIGYPLSRYSIVGREDEVDWQYTCVPRDGAPSYTNHVVVFSVDSGKVLRTIKERIITRGKGGPPGWIASLSGNLVLTRADGSKKALERRDKTLYVIIVDAGNYSDVRGLIAAGTARAQRLTASLPAGAFEVVRLNIRGRSQEYGQLLPEAFTGFGPKMLPQEYVQCRAFLYKSGKTYCLPPVYAGEFAEQWRRDRAWLVAKLAK